MKLILKNRGAGKTMDLIKESIETQAYIACNSRQECIRVHKIAVELGFSMPFPLTHQEVLDRNFYGRGIKAILIDDVELFIQRVVSVPVNTISFTANDDEQKELHRLAMEQDEKTFAGTIIAERFNKESY